MAQDLAYSFAGIIKSEKQADGTLKVYGKATDDAIDIDQQICDPTWLKRAMPDWFTSGGNIREQHSSIAAGVATDYEEKEDGHYITALVVDPTSVKKVETGVLKGFSIGIRGPRVIRDNKAAGGRIVDGQIVEVSIVDRPANPNAKLMLAKAAEGGELMAVEQINIPKPSDVFKSAPEEVIAAVESLKDPEPEAPAEEIVTEETVVDEAAAPEAPAEDAPAEDAEKSAVAADIKKFDQDLYDAAVEAISGLISVEADEAAEGSDESSSIKHLLKALKHLKEWYEGEVEEGEVSGEAALETLELSATADDKMCEKCNKSADDCQCDDTADAEKSVTVDVKLDETQVSSLLEKAVSSAKAAVEEEFTLLKSSLAEAEQKAANLAAELETAKKMAIAGGPKRSILKSADTNADELLQKAASYRQMASATQDKTLAQGYRELAAELEEKANSRKEKA